VRPRYVIALAALCLAAVGVAIFGDIGGADCGVDVFDTLASPDGRHKAVSFGVDCGATTGFNTQLSILPATAAFDREVYPPSLALDDKRTLAMRWADHAVLVVTIPKTVRIYKQEERAGEVFISYE
jgi:hypothetical protein